MTKQDEAREQAIIAINKMLMKPWYSDPDGCRVMATQIMAWLEGTGWRVPKGKGEEKQREV